MCIKIQSAVQCELINAHKQSVPAQLLFSRSTRLYGWFVQRIKNTVANCEFHPSALQSQLENAWTERDFPVRGKDTGKLKDGGGTGTKRVSHRDACPRRERGRSLIDKRSRIRMRTTVTLTFTAFDHNCARISSRMWHLTDDECVIIRTVAGSANFTFSKKD